MPGGRRGPTRQQLSRLTVPSLQTLVGSGCSNGAGLRGRGSNSMGLPPAPLTALIAPEPVRHSRIPDLPLENPLVFELLLFLYLLVALFVQYINIYRTVWWYPYSNHAASTSLNFDLMDCDLAVFISIMLARRLVWTAVSEETPCSSQLKYVLLVSFRLVLLAASSWGLCLTLASLFRNHSVLSLLFLGYPLAVYVPLCCFYREGQAVSVAADFGCLDREADSLTRRPLDFLKLLRENLWEQLSGPAPMPAHTCPPSPELIRGEVEALKADFNRRIKEVLFNSLFSAYYVAFLPLCFVKSTQYYDMRWSCEHLVMVWLNAFVMLTSQMLPPSYCDLLHRSSAHLGRWQKLEHGSYGNAPQHPWSDATIWPQGVLVRHSRSLYKAMGPYNVALPSDVSHARFYFLFHKPLRVLNLLIGIVSSVVFYQFYSLLRSECWNHTLSLGLMLSCNYYMLFKLLRDRIVLGKAYRFTPSGSSVAFKSQ
ncbi:transmembrane protein 39A-like [Paramormyrops kingsleyae]|uniref:Transmembrane protein 39A n=1 Tax=Paramormyrops kingsleyae TaxID=1676925 RepID=A0A3B3SEJ9_9TELE|nr:transmembrane protein 39A-like [Paramormyrops kingsleyae]